MTRRTGIGSGGAGTGTIGNAVGNTGGEETHTLSSAEIPATSVTVSISDPGHNHFVTNDYGASGSGGSALLSTNSQSHNYRTGNSTTGISASGSVNGSGGAHNNIQPSAVVLKIIKI
jgi:microcystin-dependent protein